MHKQKIKAFTLVELIVVITILAILGTIAFVSLQGYSANARDSVRTSDLSTMKSGLELFNLEAGSYPQPSETIIITYSGATAWLQGTFGETVKTNVDKLDKIPTDPLTDKQYVYSTTSTRNEYSIAGAFEGETLSYLNPSQPSLKLGKEQLQVEAATKTANLKLTGTYNGKVLKVSTGSTTYILAMPSIMSSSGTTVEGITTNKTLAYEGYKNLPFQYTGAYNTEGEDNLNLVNSGSIVVYAGDLAILSDTTSTGINARKTLIENLQQAYNGTSISSIGEIAQILNTNTTDQTSTEYVGTNLVANDLGGSIKAVTIAPTVTYSNCIATTSSGYTIPQLNHNQSSNVTKTGSISNGTQNYGAQANCSNGTINLVDEAINIVCTSGYVEQTGTCVQDVCGSTVPSNAHSTATSQTVSQTWTRSASAGVCTFDCDTHYTWNGSSCTADTQTTTCTGKPTNAIWNTASSISQTWNGTIWTPSESPTYNTSGSTTNCIYTCDTGYHTENAGTSCVINTRSCIISNATATETWNGSTWGTCTVTSCDSGYTQSGNACNINTYTVSGAFGANGAGATVSVCGSNVTADGSGNFTTTRNYGSTCNNISATRTGYTCSTSTNGPATLTSNTTNIAGSCSINSYTVSGAFGANGAGATVSVCGSNVTADGSGNFTTTRNYGSTCNNISATRGGYTCSTSTDGPASLTSNTTNISGSCTTNALTSCKALYDAGNTTDGIYTIDPDGAGGIASFSAYCDMTTNGGGWTLVSMERGGGTSVDGAVGAIGSFTSLNQSNSYKISDAAWRAIPFTIGTRIISSTSVTFYVKYGSYSWNSSLDTGVSPGTGNNMIPSCSSNGSSWSNGRHYHIADCRNNFGNDGLYAFGAGFASINCSTTDTFSEYLTCKNRSSNSTGFKRTAWVK